MRTSHPAAVAAFAVTVCLSLVGCTMAGAGTTGGGPTTPAVPASAEASPPAAPVASTACATEACTVVPQREGGPVDAAAVLSLSRQDVRLVDVREKAEFDRRHIDGAVNVPIGSLTRAARSWARAQPVVLYCRTGAVARSARAWLERNGFSTVYVLDGGIETWDGALVGTAPRAARGGKAALYYFYGAY